MIVTCDEAEPTPLLPNTHCILMWGSVCSCNIRPSPRCFLLQRSPWQGTGAVLGQDGAALSQSLHPGGTQGPSGAQISGHHCPSIGWLVWLWAPRSCLPQ